MIPKQLQEGDFRFVLLKPKEKAPFEKDWTNKGYKFDSERLLEHIKNGGNYGVIGGFGRLRILDIDNQELAREMIKKTNTFTIKTGSQGIHLYFLSDYETNHVLTEKNGELRAKNYQVVGAGSTHPNGNKYEVINDQPIKEVSSEALKTLISPYLRDEKKDTSRSAVEYGEVIQLIKKGKSKEEVFEEMKDSPKWSTSSEQYREHTYNKALKVIKTSNPKSIFGIEGQVEYLYKKQPFFYNRSGMFVIWDNEAKKYDVVDEVDILNEISSLGADTISTKTKSEILNGLKQFGRKNVPQNPPKTWVQFQDRIFDFKTGEEFEATPDYFISNPLPYKPSDSEDTPTIDRLFEEWVGEDYVPTLYEIVAYSCSSHQFLQRLIALVGGGSNGKGTFIKLMTKFIGEENTCSSEIKELSDNNFETSAIYKKLLCVMGEVSHDDLKNTNQLKKLSGEDPIRYCFKGKTPFSEVSGTTLISATNSLPLTPDKTLGFYRRWLIVDFPNQFTKIKGDLLERIPEEEFENLARKVLGILQRLYKEQQFTNEGDFEERMERYEARSNPVIRFVEEFCEEEAGDKLKLKDFCNAFNKFAKENHQRVMSVRQISKILKDDGFEIAKRNISHFGEDPVSAVCILHLKLPKLPKLPKSQLTPYRAPSSNSGSSGSSGSFEVKKPWELP